MQTKWTFSRNNVSIKRIQMSRSTFLLYGTGLKAVENCFKDVKRYSNIVCHKSYILILNQMAVLHLSQEPYLAPGPHLGHLWFSRTGCSSTANFRSLPLWTANLFIVVECLMSKHSQPWYTSPATFFFFQKMGSGPLHIVLCDFVDGPTTSRFVARVIYKQF